MSISRRSSGGVSSSYDGSLGNLMPFITHSDPLDSKYLSRSILEITKDVCYSSNVSKDISKERFSSHNQSNESIEKYRSMCTDSVGDKKSVSIQVNSNKGVDNDEMSRPGIPRRRFSISYIGSESQLMKEDELTISSSTIRNDESDDKTTLNTGEGGDLCDNPRNKYDRNKLCAGESQSTVKRKSFQHVHRSMSPIEANHLLCLLLSKDPWRRNNGGLYSYNSRDHSYQLNTFQDTGCKSWYSISNRDLIDPFSDNNSCIPQYTSTARRAMFELIGTSETARPDPDLSDNDLSLRFIKGTLVVCDLHGKLQLNIVPPIFGYLYKRSDCSFSFPPMRWNKRYVVVHECHLYWFDSESSYRLFGIHGARGSVNFILFYAQMDLSHNKHRFSIEFESLKKALIFEVCDNTMDRGLWTGALQAHLKKAMEIRHRTGHHIDWKALEAEVVRIRTESGLKGKFWRCINEAHNRMFDVRPPKSSLTNIATTNDTVWSTANQRSASFLSTGSAAGVMSANGWVRCRTGSIGSIGAVPYRKSSIADSSDCVIMRKDSVNIGITTCSGASGTYPGNSRRHSVEDQFLKIK
ncbi:uncharacterized protein CMU_039900 [Cryptosporidium muris RN66]|uniref:PH domain-containing protein n=1 Tax=Cryptosporidium muris (strain RN66) TaxID=441375 RepID=B6A9N0_CRYMR|nr:uncharacterized protein CMU_039900 [Cryptosporidium muris RN66]EEA04921.1 hypothetical protein CMU_039900 [Cryptosporidium muris RN66]|eukprot:XP_002139270.1 hypothetical protein [Cryptosporidium muris RN66]